MEKEYVYVVISFTTRSDVVHVSKAFRDIDDARNELVRTYGVTLEAFKDAGIRVLKSILPDDKRSFEIDVTKNIVCGGRIRKLELT